MRGSDTNNILSNPERFISNLNKKTPVMKFGMSLILLCTLVVACNSKCCIPDFFKISIRVHGIPLKEKGEYNKKTGTFYLYPSSGSADYKYKIGYVATSKFQVMWKNNTCSNEPMPFYYQFHGCIPDNLDKTTVKDGVAFTDKKLGFTLVVTKDAPGCYPLYVTFGPAENRVKVIYSDYSKEEEAPVPPSPKCSE